jgi:SNF2-related domain
MQTDAVAHAALKVYNNGGFQTDTAQHQPFADEPPGQLVDAGNEYSTILTDRFERIVLDEGHRVKNPQTLASNLVRLIHPTFTWILTATPVMNRATYYVGYLTLLWKRGMDLDEYGETMAPKDIRCSRRTSYHM